MEKSSKDLKVYKGVNLEGVSKQIQGEYTVAWRHQNPKKEVWRTRLRLYNNQKRDDDKIGDTTLFTIFQTMLASLYDDRLMVEFGGREEGDEETGENLTAMAEYDYDQMSKDELDFEWDWDTLFFGRGFMSMSEFKRDPDKNIFLPQPEVLDPITLLRDPVAQSINGNRWSRGAARFFGRELYMSQEDIRDHPHIFNKDFNSIKLGGSTRSVLQDAEEARADAQGLQYNKFTKEAGLGENANYQITEWYTHWKIGDKVKKVKVWLANDRGLVIGIQVLDEDVWPVIDRVLYPTAHDWDATSIPDLTEDKQRARAVAQNLALDAMKADLYPMYIFDTNKILNRHDLDFNYNKFIPSDGKVSDALAPLRKSFPNLPLLNFIYESLDVSAQKATATPELQQGAISESQRTLGEVNIIASKVETRYSLSAKVFGWSEKRFWQQWYWMYKKYFGDKIDEKIIKVVGAFGPAWRPLKKEDIVAKVDPDVQIQSKAVSRAKDLEDSQRMLEYLSVAAQYPDTNIRYGLKNLARLLGMEKDEIDRLYPPTVDERVAEDQNEQLNQNKTVPVLPEDDHNIHLEMHSKAKDTPAKIAHVETHKKALSIKKVKPELYPEEPEAAAYQADSGKVAPTQASPKLPGVEPLAPSQTSGINER